MKNLLRKWSIQSLLRYAEICQRQYEMPIKYFLVALMIVCSQHVATSHILTSAYSDSSLPICMKLLTYAVISQLCPTYGEYSSEEIYQLPIIPKEMTIKKWEYKEKIMKHCCTNPCTLSELVSIC